MASGYGLARQHGLEESRAVVCEVIRQRRVERGGDLKIAAGLGIGLDRPLRRRRGGGLCRVSMVGWRHERRDKWGLAGVDYEGRALPHGYESVLERFGEARRSSVILAITIGKYRGSSCASEQGRPR